MKKETAWRLLHDLLLKYPWLHVMWELTPLLFSREKIERTGNSFTLMGDFLLAWEEEEAIEILKQVKSKLKEKE